MKILKKERTVILRVDSLEESMKKRLETFLLIQPPSGYGFSNWCYDNQPRETKEKITQKVWQELVKEDINFYFRSEFERVEIFFRMIDEETELLNSWFSNNGRGIGRISELLLAIKSQVEEKLRTSERELKTDMFGSFLDKLIKNALKKMTCFEVEKLAQKKFLILDNSAWEVILSTSVKIIRENFLAQNPELIKKLKKVYYEPNYFSRGRIDHC